MKLDELERIDTKRWHTSHLAFTDDGPVSVGAKTRQFSVNSRSNRSLIGYVKWWGNWRKYVFFPLNSTLFDDKCMRQIAQFCEEATTAHKSRLPNKQRAKNMALARRERRIEQLALTKQAKCGNMDSVSEVPGPNNRVVEGVSDLTPLEIELGTITV